MRTYMYFLPLELYLFVVFLNFGMVMFVTVWPAPDVILDMINVSPALMRLQFTNTASLLLYLYLPVRHTSLSLLLSTSSCFYW